MHGPSSPPDLKLCKNLQHDLRWSKIVAKCDYEMGCAESMTMTLVLCLLWNHPDDPGLPWIRANTSTKRIFAAGKSTSHLMSHPGKYKPLQLHSFQMNSAHVRLVRQIPLLIITYQWCHVGVKLSIAPNGALADSVVKPRSSMRSSCLEKCFSM